MNSEQLNFNHNNGDLKNKKGINPVLLIILVAILLVLFGVGGWILGSKYADMENNKNNKTQDVVNKNENEKENKEDSDKVLLTEVEVKEIYSTRVPVLDKNLDGVNAYQNKKVDVNTLDGNILRGFAFWNIDFKEGDITPFVNEDGSLMCEEACSFDNLWGEGWFMFEPKLLQESAKELYGQEIENGSFDTGMGSSATYENGKYHHSMGGGTSTGIIYHRNFLSYEEKDGVLTITDKVIKLIVESKEGDYEVQAYTDSTDSKLIATKISEYDAYDKEFDTFIEDNFKDDMTNYKHTFKQDTKGNWYWVSTEPIK